MRSALIGFLLLLGLASSIFAAIPDPRDSIILESKFTRPIVGTGGVVRIRVWITNKDSLHFVTLALIETSISNGAYLILSRPRNFNGMVSRLTTTLGGLLVTSPNLGTSPPGRVYNSVSPDSMLIAGGYDPLLPSTIEPPNTARKALWDIKFDSAIVNSNAIGIVRFDTGRVVQSTVFTNTVPTDLPVNFVKSTVLIGNSPFLQLIAPLQGISVVQKQPSFIWSALRDSALNIIPASYKVFISTDSGFVSADTSPTVAETTWRKPDTLVLGQLYYWKVMAVTDDNDTVFSGETRTFTAAPIHAVAFLRLVAPSEGVSSVQRRPNFIWNLLRDSSLIVFPTEYKVLISTDSTFSSADTSPSVPETTWRKPDTLASGQLYYWKVMAITDNGDTVFSAETRFFEVLPNHSPGGFNLIYPPNGSKLVWKRIRFDWLDALDSDPRDTVKYTSYISPDSSFVTTFSQTNIYASEFIIPDSVLIRGTTYFWKIKAFDTQDSSVFSNNLFWFHFLKQGDANGDDELTPADVVLILNFLYLSIPTDPFEVSEMNCDGSLTPADLVTLLNTVFLGEPPVCDL